MAVSNTRTLLKEMVKSLNDSYVRGLIDDQKQIVTLEKANIIEAWKEGYNNLLNKHKGKDFPEIKHQEWEEGVTKAWSSIRESITTNKGTLIEYTPNTIVFTEGKKTKSTYDGIKSYSVSFIQDKLKDYKLTNATDEKANNPGMSFSGAAGYSDIGQIKKGTHRLHQGSTSVGAARLALSMKWLAKTRFFKDFTSSKEAKRLEDKYGDILAMFETKGTKKRGLQLSPNEDISITINASSQNYPGSEATDWTKIQADLTKELMEWARNAELSGKKGSISIKDNAVNIAEYVVIAELSKVKNAKVAKNPKGSSREAKKVTYESKGKNPKTSKNAKASTRKPRARINKGVSAQPLALIGLINKQLPEQVAANMGSPYLNFRTGRFAESVRVVDVVKTRKGYPSFGYTYQKGPYQTFEPGYAQGDINRDPRKIIDKSIREIAAEFAIGRFYTRRL
jgi:hypothetical protein